MTIDENFDLITVRPRWRCACCHAGMSGYRCKCDGSQAIFLCSDCCGKSAQLLKMGISPRAIAQNDSQILEAVENLDALLKEQNQNGKRNAAGII